METQSETGSAKKRGRAKARGRQDSQGQETVKDITKLNDDMDKLVRLRTALKDA